MPEILSFSLGIELGQLGLLLGVFYRLGGLQSAYEAVILTVAELKTRIMRLEGDVAKLTVKSKG